MKTIFILLTLGLMSLQAWTQEFYDEDQYPETDPATLGGGEFIRPSGLPSSDFEEGGRQEEEAIPEESFSQEQAPQDLYEGDEEYLE